jgi:hypothetical protein
MLADDLPPKLLDMVASLTKRGVNSLWNYFANSSIGAAALKALGTDADLNDDQPVMLGNRFSNDASLNRMSSWVELDPVYRNLSS